VVVDVGVVLGWGILVVGRMAFEWVVRFVVVGVGVRLGCACVLR
jgi:hypothetical protein